jgi:DnaJ-class molecular chaperone
MRQRTCYVCGGSGRVTVFSTGREFFAKLACEKCGGRGVLRGLNKTETVVLIALALLTVTFMLFPKR